MPGPKPDGKQVKGALIAAHAANGHGLPKHPDTGEDHIHQLSAAVRTHECISSWSTAYTLLTHLAVDAGLVQQNAWFEANGHMCTSR